MRLLLKNSVLLSFFLILLSGCSSGLRSDASWDLSPSSSEVILPKDTMIDTESLINKTIFMEESRKRTLDIINYGPTMKVADDKANRDKPLRQRVHIDKEDALDYSELSSDDGIDVFPIDINVENMEIRTFAKLLSKVTGINILVSEEVTGTVTAGLHNMPWTTALDSILQIKSLAKHVDVTNNIIRIHSQDAIIKLENFERNRRGALQKTQQLALDAEPMYTEVFKLYYTDPEEVKLLLESSLGVIITAGDKDKRDTSAKITVDERKNLLIIKARKRDLEIIEKLISELDTRTKQIFIEAFIVEVTDGFQKEFGTRIGGNFSDDGFQMNREVNGQITGLVGGATSTVSPGVPAGSFSDLAATGPMAGISFLAGIGAASDLRLELTAMENKGLSKVISNPRIFTLDNQEAVIFQGTEVPYETVSQDGTKIEFKEAGLKLTVTPTVIGDGNLILNMHVNKDTVDITVSNPPITKSEIITTTVTKDGSVVAIGGIYVETKTGNVDKVPFFGDIPVIGKLFRRDSKREDKKELIIFISPHIL